LFLFDVRVEEFGETDMRTAEAYYEYGNALLTLQEENPTDNLIGNDAEDVEVGDDDDEQEKDEEDGQEDEKNEAGGAVDNNNNANNVDADDLQIAWENLEAARVILERDENETKTDSNQSLLASVRVIFIILSYHISYLSYPKIRCIFD
jgi:hypothetical protein